MTSPRAPA